MKIYAFFIVLLKTFLVLSILKFITANAFSECPVTPNLLNKWDPIYVFISNCLSLVAYYQSKGENIQQWCSNYNNYQKCCLTCQNYLKLRQCNDIAYEPDCKMKAQLGLCNTNLSNNIPLSAYCPKSCNVCKPDCSLGCDQVDCNTGSCYATNYFSVSSIQCTCPPDRGGTYCQLANPCLFSPCKNGGQCSPSYADYQASYTCSCPDGYQGKNCEICNRNDACSSVTCLNDGTCVVDVSGNGVCLCKPGYSGKACENFCGACISNPCKNGGTCELNSFNSGYTCSCPTGFSGETCDYQVTSEICMVGDLNSTMCIGWKIAGLCDFKYLYGDRPVPMYCPKTCGLCDDFLPSCCDKESNCQMWVNMGLCDWLSANNPTLCPKSCNKCVN